MLVMSSLVSVTGFAANSIRTDTDEQRFNAEYPTEDIDLELDIEITEYICGYSLDRQTRGDCESNDAPGELWFKFTIPNNSVGDVFKFEIVNKDDPHYVDLSVNLCKGNKYYTEQLVCKIYDDMYSNTEQDLSIAPVISSHYFLHIVAWDEEKEQRKAGGDLTQVEVKISRLGNSNLDNLEPIEISNVPNSGLLFENNVCAIGCDEGDIDAFDIYTIFGIKGDFIQLQFGSNEGDVNSDFGVEVFLEHEADFFVPNLEFTSYLLDDSYEFSDIETTNDGVTLLNYTWETSGVIYLRFHSKIGDDSFAGEEIEDYWFTISNLDISNRNHSVDLDIDGLPDAMEYQCGSDLRVASDTALDTDSDKVCDLFDDDDDNDGMSDDEEFRCNSDPKDVNNTAPDHDNDRICNEFDLDDDNDGMLDQEEIRCGSDYRNSSDIADDNDNDGVCDEFDLDDDNDGMLDSMENFCGSDPNSSISTAPDYDNDGQCDDIDDDDDGDGRTDKMEIECLTNPFKPFDFYDDDFDWDGICDLVDDDDDDDGVLDNIDLCDNTYWEDVFDQTDSDGDGCFYDEDPCPYIFGITLMEGCGGAFDGQGTENSAQSEDSFIDGFWDFLRGAFAVCVAGSLLGIILAGTAKLSSKSKTLIASRKQNKQPKVAAQHASPPYYQPVIKLKKQNKNKKPKKLKNQNKPKIQRNLVPNSSPIPLKTRQLTSSTRSALTSSLTNQLNISPSAIANNNNTQILNKDEAKSITSDKGLQNDNDSAIQQIETGLSIVTKDMIKQEVTKVPRNKEDYDLFEKEIDNLITLTDKGINVNLLDYEKSPIPKIIFRLRGTNKLTDIIGHCNNTAKHNIIIDLIDYMVSIHNAGFVHRDLKPDNILIDKKKNGNHSFETIIDFGISMKINSRQKDRFNTAGTPFFSHKSQQNSDFNAVTGQDWFSMARIIALIIRGKDTNILDAEIQMLEDGLDIQNEIQHIGFDDKQTSFIQKIVSIATDKNCHENKAVRELTKVGKSLPSFKTS